MYMQLLRYAAKGPVGRRASMAGLLTAPNSGLWNSLNLHPHLVDARARRDVKCFAVRIAEFDVGAEFGQMDRAEVLARRRDDPDSARARLPKVALYVDAQAIGDPPGRVAVNVDQHPAVLERAVRIDVIGPDEPVTAAVGIEDLLVRREGDAVGIWNIVDNTGHLAILDHVDAVEIQLLSGIVFA